MPISIFVTLVLYIGCLTLSVAEPAEEGRKADPDFWEKTRELTDDAWSKAREMADDTWQSTRDFIDEPEEEDSFARVWEGVISRLEEARELEDQHDGLPEKAWFEKDQADNREDINELLDEAIGVLLISPSQRYRARIRELQKAIQKTQVDIAEYRKQRVAAPTDALLKKTVAEYDAAIAEHIARIAEYRRELQILKSDFAQQLQQQGLQISDEQLDFLLSNVIGDDLLNMGIAFDNVKDITSQLEQLMVESQEDLISARRYYGMYTILLKVLERMHQHVIDAVNNRYLVEIDAITNRTQTLLTETRELQRRSPANRQILSANIEAQELTLRTANFYRSYLIDQSRDVAKARDSLAQDIAIAENTYETVKLSGELVALMQSSQRLLETLARRQVPALRTFENLEMKREFEKLSAQLREGVGP